ncbi:MAG: hypothetical protein V3V40_03990 [Nitrosomonadaceae bacterium]
MIVVLLLLPPLADNAEAEQFYCDVALWDCFGKCEGYFGWYSIFEAACDGGCAIGYQDCIGA